MNVGSLGPHQFKSSRAPSEIAEELRYGYAEHGRALGRASLERVGDPSPSVSFSLRLVEEAGLPSPREALASLRRIAADGTVVPLFLGSQYFGRYVIEGLRVSHKDPGGRLIDLDVSLKLYDDAPEPDAVDGAAVEALPTDATATPAVA